jgi:hypothetical protein
MITYFDAVNALLKCDLSGPTDGPISEFSLPEGVKPPTEEAIQAKLAELQADYDSKQYQRDRIYPNIGDQLDMIYWDKINGTENWKEAIENVKADNPKPS